MNENGVPVIGPLLLVLRGDFVEGESALEFLDVEAGTKGGRFIGVKGMTHR